LDIIKGHYLITGATGFLGRVITECFVNSGCMVTILVRDVNRCSEFIKRMISEEKIKCYTGDIVESDFIDRIISKHETEQLCSVDYILHFAATTQSKNMIDNPVEVADGIVLGTKNILELARKLNVLGMVYISSMEVYGRVEDKGTLVTEEELGDVDIFNERSCYPMGKRMAEQYCYNYYCEYGVPVKIARLAQTFGTGISPEDNRVFMQFVKAAYENRDIVLKTKGLSYGNYCETMDAIRGILTILQKGKSGEAYNVVNEANTMRIKEMAQLVSHCIANDRINVTYDIDNTEKNGYAADTQLRLSGEKLRMLGWTPSKNLEQMYRDLYNEITKRN